MVLGQSVSAEVPTFPISQQMINDIPTVDIDVNTVLIGGDNAAFTGIFNRYILILSSRDTWAGLDTPFDDMLYSYIDTYQFYVSSLTSANGFRCRADSTERCFYWDTVQEKWIPMVGYDNVRVRADFDHRYFYSNSTFFVRGNNDPDKTNGQYPVFTNGQLMYTPDSPAPTLGQWITDSYRIVWNNRQYYQAQSGVNGYYVKLQPNSHYTFTFSHFFPHGTRDVTAIQYRACLYDTDYICDDSGIFHDADVNEYPTVYDNMAFAPWELDTTTVGDTWTWRISTLAKVGNDWREFAHFNLYIEVSEDGVLPNGSLIDEEIDYWQNMLDEKYNELAIWERSIIKAMSILFIPSDNFLETQITQISAARDKKLSFYVDIKNSFDMHITSMSTATAPPSIPKLSLYGSNVDVIDVSMLDPHISTLRGFISAFIWIFLAVFIIKKVSNVIRT